ncbi:ephrin-A1 isoform X1 [Canis lupus baileyi]|uniref:ephrin-A1 isoform X1 n=1 Tax=Canis lupus dingo TaxID=286419 RepID=UPI000DC677AE|nr:ephrin-A1 isoform X1 [Canis lupus dingo]XP_038399072.1 ephrin-A1 isoform X1 [Canis lupus familiaris]XP_038527904.1 ephrin-A1 isoform X1 [Canis lupus familiaris]
MASMFISPERNFKSLSLGRALLPPLLLPRPVGEGEGEGWLAARWHAAPEPGRWGPEVPTLEASRPNSCPPPARALARAPVGSRFRNEDYTVHVRLNDYLDIICPHYEDDAVADTAMERYTLYLVEHEQYQLCQPQSKDQVRWQCNQPSARHGPEKLSEKFQRFTPFTLGKEFKEGHSYYYISKPIHHQEDRCLKLKVTVSGKITHSPQAHANPQEKRLLADDPEIQVLHSIGHSAAPRLFPLAWVVLLLPFLLLQTP